MINPKIGDWVQIGSNKEGLVIDISGATFHIESVGELIPGDTWAIFGAEEVVGIENATLGDRYHPRKKCRW